MMFYQSATNFLRNITLRRMLFTLSVTLILSVFLPAQVIADDEKGFCFGKEGITCSTDNNGGHLSSNVFLENYSGGDLSTGVMNFYFRAYDGDDGGEWGIWPRNVRYCGNDIHASCTGSNSGVIGNEDGSGSNTNNYNRIDWVRVRGQTKDNWVPELGESDWMTGITGDDHTHVPLKLRFTLKKEWLEELLPGYHKVRVRIRGKEISKTNNPYSDLDVYIRVFIPDNVAISGLEPVDFGTFSESFDVQRTITQSVCAHAQGGGGFKITASNDKGSYFLKGAKTEKPIYYKVGFGPKEDDLKPIIYGFPNGSIEDGFIGHINDYCDNNENMWLGITLTETFESLSTKPADIYSDKLTLTISPN